MPIKPENLKEATEYMDELIAVRAALTLFTESTTCEIVSVKIVIGVTGLPRKSTTINLPKSIASDRGFALLRERETAALNRLEELGVNVSTLRGSSVISKD